MSEYLRPLDEVEHACRSTSGWRMRCARRCATRILKPDEALPPERDLAADLSVSRITVRKALDGLVEEGLLVRRQGAGTFVATASRSSSRSSRPSRRTWARAAARRAASGSKSAGGVTPDEALTLGRARARRFIVSTVSAMLTTSPWPLNIRRSRASACRRHRYRRQLALRGARRNRQPPGARAPAAARGAVQCRTGEAARHRGGRARAATSSGAASSGRPRDRGDAVAGTAATPMISSPNSTRGADHGGRRSTRMFLEAGEAGDAVARQLAANADLVVEVAARGCAPGRRAACSPARAAAPIMPRPSPNI